MQASWLSFKPTHLFVFPYAYAAALILHWFGSLKIPIIPCGFVALLFHSPIRFFLYTKTHVFQCFQCIFHPNWFGTRLIYLLRVMWDSPGRGSRPQFHVLPISAHGTKAAMALRCRGLRGLQKNKQTFVVENRNLLRSTPFLRVSSCHVWKNARQNCQSAGISFVELVEVSIIWSKSSNNWHRHRPERKQRC